MRAQVTIFDTQYRFMKTFKSEKLMIAYIEYMFEDIEPSGLNEQEMELFESLRLRMDNCKKKSDAGSKSHGGGAPAGNSNAVKNWETTTKQQQNDNKTTANQQEDKDKDKEEDNKIKEIHKEKEMCNKLHDEYGFDLFWSKYPVKKDKKKAMQKFNKMNAEKRKSAIEGIEKLKQSDSWKRGYIPLPTTYLNGERREDEVETKGSSYSFEQMKERERQRRMEQAREILTRNQSTDGNSSETQATNRRANISGM